MFVKSYRASAGLDRPGDDQACSPSAPKAVIKTSGSASTPRFAKRAFEAPLGRCVALRIQSGNGRRPDRLLALLVPRYTTAAAPRWLRLTTC
ncbi:MAG: hypothetical protein AB1761_08245 [Pseudomonadota bacterium]